MSNEIFGIIYKATNIINGKSYIGQTTIGLEKRKKTHERCDKNNMYFHRALKKYGSKNFLWEELDTCYCSDELNEMEFHYIKQYNTLKPNGYNMYYNTYCQSGSLNPNYGNTMSVESRDKISIAAKERFESKENHPWYGRKHSEESKNKMRGKRHFHLSEETIKKLSEIRKGRKVSDNTRRKLSNLRIGSKNPFYGRTHSEHLKEDFKERFKGEKNPFYGKKHSDETKIKMREAWEIRRLKKLLENN